MTSSALVSSAVETNVADGSFATRGQRYILELMIRRALKGLERASVQAPFMFLGVSKHAMMMKPLRQNPATRFCTMAATPRG